MRILSFITNAIIGFYKSYLRHKFRKGYQRKIRSLLDGTERLSNEQIHEVRKFYKPYRKIKLHWHKWYFSKNGLFSTKYIPEDIFVMDIEPTLNNDIFTQALDDKNFYDIIFKSEEIVLPKTLVRSIDGYLSDAEYNHINIEEAFSICSSEPEIILKKSINSAGGHDIKFIKLQGEMTGSQFLDRLYC